MTVTCRVDAKPRLTSLFWIIAANGTTLTDSGSDTQDRQFHSRLHVRRTALLLSNNLQIKKLFINYKVFGCCTM